MADLKVKISELPAGTPTDTDVIPYVDLVTGTTKKAVKSDLEGTDGTNATATAGTTTTLPAGSSATVVNSGTTNDAIFDFGIPEGEDGIDGTDGDSAYEIAVNNGFIGTEAEWLLSLDGTDGIDGTDGADGVMQSIVAGTNITVDATDPANPIVSSTGGSGGSNGGQPLFFSNEVSDVSGYYKLDYNFEATETEVAEVVTAGGSPLLSRTFLFDEAVDVTELPAGSWASLTTAKVSSAILDSFFTYEFFVRDTGGTETTLFSYTGGDIDSETYARITDVTTQGELTVSATDRVGIRIYVSTTRTPSTTITYKLGGSDASYVTTPLALRHNQLRDIEQAGTGVTDGHISDQAQTIVGDKTFTGSIINAEIQANTAKVTNATHTGEVTGSTALTISDNVIDEAHLKLDEAPTNDYVLTADSTKSGGMKWAEASGGGGGAEYAIFQEQQTAVTAADSVSTGSFGARTLNTTEYNGITGASLSSNQITLPAGTYMIESRSPAYDDPFCISRLQNISDSTTALGGDFVSSDASDPTSTYSYCTGVITIASSKSFELQARHTSTSSGGYTGLSWGQPYNVYSSITITKIA